MAVLRVRRLAAGLLSPATADVVKDVVPRQIGRDIYTCPAGNRAVVRDIRLVAAFASGALTTMVNVYVGGVTEVRVCQAIITTGKAFGVTGQIVLEPGDVMTLITEEPECYYYFSGAQLPLPVVP